jgi:hypothetical protein
MTLLAEVVRIRYSEITATVATMKSEEFVKEKFRPLPAVPSPPR